MNDARFSTYIEQLHRDFSFFCGEELRKKGVSVGLLYFILEVCTHPGCTPTDLTRDLSLDRAYVLRTIQKLVEEGFFRREAHPTDRRATVLYATEKGKEIFELGQQLLCRWEDRVLDGMSENEKEQLFMLLKRIESKGD